MVKALLIIGTLQVLTIAVQIARAKVISVTLGPSGLGVIGLIDQLLTTLVQVCSLSLPAVALRLLPRVHGTDTPAFQRQYAAFLKAIVIASVAGSGVTAVGVYLRPGMLGQELEPYSVDVIVALIGGPILAVGVLLPNVLAASHRPSGAAWIGFGLTAVTGLAAWVGLQLGGIRDIYALQLVFGAALIGATLVYFKRALHLPFYDPHGHLANELRHRPDIIPSAAVTYLAVAGSALALFAVRYATVRTLGTESVGWLQAVLSMVLSVGVVLASMNGRYLGPMLNTQSEVSAKTQVAESFRKRQLILLTVMALPLVVFSEDVLALLYSRQFMPAAAWLPPFLLWQLLLLQSGVQTQLLFALDDLWPVAAVPIVGHAVSAVLSFVLVPRYGLSGAAAAMMAGATLMLVVGAERLRRRHNYTVQHGSVWLAAYIGAALLGAPAFLNFLGPLGTSLSLRLTLIVGLMSGLWLFMAPNERAALYSLRHRIR